MKIVSLEAENVKKLKAVSIKPDGSTIIIGGDNEAGKSSILDSIEYALAGTKGIPSKPIRDGQEKAKIVLDLGDIVVTRTFTKSGTNLVVKSKEGASYSSPQAMLDKLVGDLSFDPLEFCRMDSKKKLETLKKVVGLDFTNLDKEYKKVFDERTDINRRGKELKAQFESLPEHDSVPEQEISMTDLSKQLTDAIENNRNIETLNDSVNKKNNRLEWIDKEIKKLQDEKKNLKTQIDKDKESLKALEFIHINNIESQISSCESNNKKVRENQKRNELGNELNDLRIKSKDLTDRIESINKEKQDLLENAKFPIKGLGFTEDEVMFGEIPFEQCSSAQQVKISVAMGLAMNPKLKILLVRDGSLLDEKNLKMVAEMAQKHDGQVWIERVSKGKECSIIICDGSINET